MAGADSTLFRQFQKQVWGEDGAWGWICPQEGICSPEAMQHCPIARIVRETRPGESDWDVFLRARPYMEQHHLDPGQKRTDGKTPATQANTVLICSESHTNLHASDPSASRLPRQNSIISSFLKYISSNLSLRGGVWKSQKVNFSLSIVADSLDTTKGWISEIIRGKMVDGESKYRTNCLKLKDGMIFYVGKRCSTCYFNGGCDIQNNGNI